jgi:NADH-quinone oxidoreductase subunit K
MGDFIISFFSGPVPIEAYLAVSTIMFFAGVYGFLSRKNMLMVLISLELMLNAADLNFVIFNRYLYPGQLEGFFFTLFAIGIAAAETAVAIAIIINIYRNMKSIYIDENITKMKN